MSNEEIERERGRGRVAGILALVSAVALLVPGFIGLGTEFGSVARDAYAERLAAFDAESSEILASQLIQALGVLLFIAPLFFLFRAAMDRNERVRRGLIGLTVAGPLFLAISLVVFYFAYDAATPIFLEGQAGAEDLDQFAEDTLFDQSAWSIFTGLQLAGALGMIVGLVYTSLQAMRTGLLTRFAGTLGMALGVGFFLLGTFALAIWAVTVGLVIAGWWRGPRPPAWEAGEAIPWPKAGAAPAPTDEELARAEDFDGSGRELLEEPLEEEEPGADSDLDPEPSRPGRRDNRRKRKRKQRG
jgi:hypothetical protein